LKDIRMIRRGQDITKRGRAAGHKEEGKRRGTTLG
jgi:hypothetical protein